MFLVHPYLEGWGRLEFQVQLGQVGAMELNDLFQKCPLPANLTPLFLNTVIPRLTKIIRSGITFVSRNLRWPKRAPGMARPFIFAALC